MALPIRPGVLFGLLREIGQTTEHPILVAGVLADELARELREGGDPAAVRTGGEPKGAAVLVYVLGDDVTKDDERVLKAAHRARVPTIAVAAGRAVPSRIPFVLATDIVRVAPGHGFPIDRIAHATTARLGEKATSLARRLPVLRPAVCRQLIESFSRKNAIISAAVFIPGVDMPVLTVNQIRMVLRICTAYGLTVDAQRVPELVATIGAGFGFRAVARELLAFIPILGWAVKGAVAYAGTRALGEAAIRYCEARTATAAAAGFSFRFFVLIARSRCKRRAHAQGSSSLYRCAVWPRVASRYSNHASASSISSNSYASRLDAIGVTSPVDAPKHRTWAGRHPHQMGTLRPIRRKPEWVVPWQICS